jgi:hypothetical protein
MTVPSDVIHLKKATGGCWTVPWNLMISLILSSRCTVPSCFSALARTLQKPLP